MANTLQACQPCDCSKYGQRDVYNITDSRISKWLTNANKAGKAHGMNPATFLAIASLETNGDSTLSGGIVQVGSTMLSQYNSAKGTSYTANDLKGTGTLVKTASAAVDLSFDILGQYMKAINSTTNNFSYTATGWNGAICGTSGSVKVFGSNAAPVPTGASCYGVAASKLASAYSGWWVNPSTGQASSFYFKDLTSVSPNPLAAMNTACYGNK